MGRVGRRTDGLREEMGVEERRGKGERAQTGESVALRHSAAAATLTDSHSPTTD